MPTVDPPVVALASSSTMVSGDVADYLKTDDKKTELTLRKTF